MSERLNTFLLICTVALTWYAMLTVIYWFTEPGKPVRIDCSMAEFHPDYTPKMREQCRLLRSGKVL